MSWFDKRHQAKDAFLTLSLSKYTRGRRGRSSAVERQLPKLNVVGSTPIARSNSLPRSTDDRRPYPSRPGMGDQRVEAQGVETSNVAPTLLTGADRAMGARRLQ